MERAALLAALLCVACASNGSSDPIAEAPASIVPTSSAAPVDSQAQPCPIAPLTLVSEDPNRPGLELLSLQRNGDIELGLSPHKQAFTLDPAGCLLFQGKLVAELLPDGRILSDGGVSIGTLHGQTLTLPHSEIVIAEDGAVARKPSGGLPQWRLVGHNKSTTCAAAMLVVALGQAVAGASMAVNDGGAKRPPSVPAPPGSRCAHVQR